MQLLLLALQPRFLLLTASVVVSVLLPAVIISNPNLQTYLVAPLVLSVALAALGARDLTQTKHAILRNYPIAAHLRFLLESIRPEMRQYFFEGEKDGTPFPRDKRAIVYQRAKKELDKRPFGTHYDVYENRYEWLAHSMSPKVPQIEPFRTLIGGPQCTQPYSASVFNISAMSYGSLSANAIRALNKGAKIGGFAHDTGEGSVSPYHKEFGGDLIWEIGSGYFGCRTLDGSFSPEKFAAVAASPQIKMIEIKLSQGAKPGHGGVLPGAKVSGEIAYIRGVEPGRDCISPAQHSAFSTPLELVGFIAELRRLSNGKPVGIKLCVGHRWEFLAVLKACLQTGISPDFIVVDGNEGGTGAAPLEFLDHVGTPLRDGLAFVHSALRGANLRDNVKIGASGKITSGFDIARAMALGADWCNAARGFMFSVGCIQAQQCHTDKCPTGVATQDVMRQRAVSVPAKSERVASFHKQTVKALSELTAAAGLDHPSELNPTHFMYRAAPDRAISFAELHKFLAPGELIAGTNVPLFRDAWDLAQASSFSPSNPNSRSFVAAAAE
ncbi:MAG: FMN-binding glutamate synthase family protein [Hyphomicrobium sp.]